MDGSGPAVVIKKSMLPHPILRDLHSDIELMLTNCRKVDSENLVDIEHKSGIGDKSDNLIVNDSDANLVIFCRTLEKAFRQGMEETVDGKSFDYFDIFWVLAKQTKAERSKNSNGSIRETKLSLLFCHVVEEIQIKLTCLSTSCGRGRHILRYSLTNSGLLVHLIDCLQAWTNIDTFYRPDALVRQKTDGGNIMTLRSLLESLSKRCRFELDLSNRSFLDTTWDRPELRRIELVPCKDLGLMICPIRGYIVVTKVKTYSVAGEDSKVEVGDILEEMDGVSLFAFSPEGIAKMVKKAAGKLPIRLAVVKAKPFGGQFIFPAITPLLIEAGLDVDKLEETKTPSRIRFRESANAAEEASLLSDTFDDDDEEEEEQPQQPQHQQLQQQQQQPQEETKESSDLVSQEKEEGTGSKNMFMAKHGYHLSYIGSLQVGRIGENNSFLDHAISRVVNAENKIDHNVSLHILEFGVRLYCRKSGKQVLYYPYPKISACGLSSLNANYLSFIGAEDDVCALAKKFLCHVFYTENRKMAKQIVASMGLGFDRTLSAA